MELHYLYSMNTDEFYQLFIGKCKYTVMYNGGWIYPPAIKFKPYDFLNEKRAILLRKIAWHHIFRYLYQIFIPDIYCHAVGCIIHRCGSMHDITNGTIWFIKA